MQAFVRQNWLVILIFMVVIALVFWTYLGYVELNHSLQKMQASFPTERML